MIGFLELDDVKHNMVGCLIGYILVHGLNDLNDNTNNDYKLEDIEKQ